MSISIDQIHLPEFLLRDSYTDVDNLALSIQNKGLLYPIMIRKDKDFTRVNSYEVVAGCRRFTALKQLGRTEIYPNEVIVRDIDDKLAFEISLIENIQRNSMTAMEEAKAFKRYTVENGYGSAGDLAKVINKSPAFISERIGLLNLPSDVQEQIGVVVNLTASHGEALSRADLPPEKIEELVDLIKYKEMSVADTNEVIVYQKLNPEESIVDSNLKVETDKANEPYRLQAQNYQADEQAKEEEFTPIPRPKEAQNPILENIRRLDLCINRMLDECDTWVRKIQDIDFNYGKELVTQIRFPLHEIAGKSAQIREEYERKVKKERKERTK